MARVDLDAEQTDAILELKLYRLAPARDPRDPDELEERRGRAKQIGVLLNSEIKRWGSSATSSSAAEGPRRQG